MSNKPDYINKEVEIDNDINSNIYKNQSEITKKDVIIAASGLTDSGELKSTVELYWDLDEQGIKSNYKELEVTEAMLKINNISGFIQVELVFDKGEFQLNILHEFLSEYFSPNANTNRSLEVRIIPKSMEGEVMIIADNPIMMSVSSFNLNDLDTVQMLFEESNIEVGYIGSKDIKWKVETLPINFEKSII